MLSIVKIPEFVKESSNQYQPVFSHQQHKHFQRYLTGLMTDPNVTVTNMSERFHEPVSQRSLNRFLTEYEWDPQQLNQQRLMMLQKDPQMQWHNKGVVIIDDSLLEKSGKLIPGAGKFFDHNTCSYVHAQNIVTSHYADWKKHYPLHFRQYYKEDSKEALEHGFKTKIQLAMELVDDAETLKIPAETYVLDGWFLCKELADNIESHNKNWVMAAKCSLLLWNKDRWMNLTEYAKQVPKEIYHKVYAGGNPYWVHTNTVKLQSLDRKIKLAVSYDNPELEGEPKFIVSNVTRWDANHIIRLYYLRHLVETFYRDAKQHLGLEGCQLRKLEGVHRHITLVFTAYSILKQGAVGSGLSRWLKTKVQTIGDGCRYVVNQVVEALVMLVYQLALQHQNTAQILQTLNPHI